MASAPFARYKVLTAHILSMNNEYGVADDPSLAQCTLLGAVCYEYDRLSCHVASSNRTHSGKQERAFF